MRNHVKFCSFKAILASNFCYLRSAAKAILLSNFCCFKISLSCFCLAIMSCFSIRFSSSFSLSNDFSAIKASVYKRLLALMVCFCTILSNCLGVRLGFAFARLRLRCEEVIFENQFDEKAGKNKVINKININK